MAERTSAIFFRMMGDIARFGADLGHDDRVAGRVGSAQSRDVAVELIAENENQPVYHGTDAPVRSKNPPLSDGVSPSMTSSRSVAAVAGGTVGWRPA